MKHIDVSLLVLVLCSDAVVGQTFRAKLVPSDGYREDHFGRAVSVSGGVAIAGAYADDDKGVFSGSAYVFRKEGFDWIQEAKLVASDGDANDEFGDAVSISGDRAIVGAFRDEPTLSGSAYVFRREGFYWIEEAKLIPSDGEYYDYFGSAVAISGDHAVVGAPGDDIDNTIYGSVYVFRRIGTDWVEEAKLIPDGSDEFAGESVSISDDRIIIGSDHFYDHGGFVYIYRFDDPNWILEAKISASDGSVLDYFSCSVSISGDRAIVGAYGDDDNFGNSSGSAYVFRRRDTAWIEEAKLTASDAADDDHFGFAVSLSGDQAVVGAPYSDDHGGQSGSIYFFRRDGFKWVEESKLTARDADTSNYFGWSVSISNDDAVVGVFRNNDNGVESGSAYAYEGFSADVSAVVAISPSSGSGAFDYDIGLSNNSDGVLQVDIWTELFGPGGGHKAGQIFTDKIIDGGLSYQDSGMQSLGVGAPPGDYTFTVTVGEYPDIVTASGSATYTKTTIEKEEPRRGESESGAFGLLQNHPNPFNPKTAINFQLGEVGHTTLVVYDILGREVAWIVNEALSPGLHTREWDASAQPSGVYYCKLNAGQSVATRKILLLR